MGLLGHLDIAVGACVGFLIRHIGIGIRNDRRVHPVLDRRQCQITLHSLFICTKCIQCILAVVCNKRSRCVCDLRLVILRQLHIVLCHVRFQCIHIEQ